MQYDTRSFRKAIDPVCKMTVDVRRATIGFTFGEETYYFCAQDCRKAFQDCPKKYLQSSAEKKKGWWGRYLDRLRKATGGKPIKCH